MEMCRNGVAYSFWILDGGQWLPLYVSHIIPGEMTHSHWLEDYMGHRDCPGIVGS